MARLRLVKFTLILSVLIITLACRQSIQPLIIPAVGYQTPTTELINPSPEINQPPIAVTQTAAPDPLNAGSPPMTMRAEEEPIATPTPDTVRELPEVRTENLT